MKHNQLQDDLHRLMADSRRLRPRDITNADVGEFVKSLGPEVFWRPDVVLQDRKSGQHMAFSVIYEADAVPVAMVEQVEKVRSARSFEFFFVLEDDRLLGDFSEECSLRGYGLVVRSGKLLRLARDAMPPLESPVRHVRTTGPLPKWLLVAAAGVELGNSRFQTVIGDFARVYARFRREDAANVQREERLVHDFIARLLASDGRFTLGIDPLVVLRRFESSFGVIRDHYFHSCQILLLGLVILARYRVEFTKYFRTVFPRYEDLSLEFAWLLTAIFHDVGYPVSRMDSFKHEVYGTTMVAPEREVANVWADPAYVDNLRQLASLLRYAIDPENHRRDWEPDAFPRNDSELEHAIRDSFHSSHGVAGAFILMNDIVAEARTEKNDEKRVFWAKHVYTAALAIALHDRGFRGALAACGVKRMKLSRFPFAVLLSYLDSIQEDARDVYLCPERPEFLEGFDFNGKVLARVNSALAKEMERLPKLRVECQDFGSFFDCDGLRFVYPPILISGIPCTQRVA